MLHGGLRWTRKIYHASILGGFRVFLGLESYRGSSLSLHHRLHKGGGLANSRVLIEKRSREGRPPLQYVGKVVSFLIIARNMSLPIGQF